MFSKKTDSQFVFTSLVHSLGVVVYISLVALFMSNGESLLGNEDTVWTVIAVLMLLSISAAVVGSLVFGRPLLMALDGKKSEALMFALYTIGWLIVEAIVFFIILAATR